MNSASPNRTVRELIQVTADFFAGKGVDSPRLCAERLLADVLGLARIELYFQHDRPVLGRELDRYRQLVRRRAAGEPLQKILGQTEFYSRAFKVEPGVFIPRPETERLVEIAVGLLSPADHRLLAPVAVEIGCGSGVIAVCLALEIPRLTVHAVDLDPGAVELTRHNAHLHGVDARVHVHQGNRFDPLPRHLRGAVDLLASNPPYIRSEDIAGLAEEVKGHDPLAALDGGKDGLDSYRAIAHAMANWLRPGGAAALEIGADQGAEVSGILAASGAQDLQVHQDYAGRDRVVTARMGKAEEGHG